MNQRKSSSGRAGATLRAAFFVACAGLARAAGDDGNDPAAGLRSGDKWNRARAVEALARRGTKDDWRLVIGALADAKGEVADTAQLMLAGLPRTEGAELIETLGGRDGLKSRDALVRARVAELLGRLVDPPIPDLVRTLKDDEPEVRRMGAWSIERLAQAGRLSAEARAELVQDVQRRARSDRDERVQARALFALAALDPVLARGPVEEALRARDASQRAAAAGLLCAVDDGEWRTSGLQRLARDEERSVRVAAADALAALGTLEAARTLVQRLELEPETRLRLALLGHLQALSGLRHRFDARPWNDWLAELEPDWRAAPAIRRSSAALDPGERTTALAGLPILSQRLTILIDLSGSIWSQRADGTTRKQVVDKKLREALEGLTPEVHFNLIPYTGEPHPWKPKLVPASRLNVRAAASWFEGLHESGSGNFWDAALLALEDPDVDTLVVLFDGAPTGGARHRLELLVPLFLEFTATRRVAVDLVLVDAPRRLLEFWQELADGTGGQLLPVSF